MKKLSLLAWMLIASFVFVGCSSDDDNAKVIVSFEGQLKGDQSFFLGENGVEEGWYLRSDFKDSQKLVEFTHYYTGKDFGGGFTYTNQSDKTTPGYNNLSAITGAGRKGSTYITANANDFTPAQITNLKPDQFGFKGVWVTNTTYAYLAIKDGNVGGGPGVQKFEAGDWFKLAIAGYDEKEAKIGEVTFYLADFRNKKENIVEKWSWIDLTALADAEYIEFTLSSSDNGDWGMNTPSYFCIDGITLEEKNFK